MKVCDRHEGLLLGSPHCNMFDLHIFSTKTASHTDTVWHTNTKKGAAHQEFHL